MRSVPSSPKALSQDELRLQTLELARQFARISGRKVDHGHRFDRATEGPDHFLWTIACFAQRSLTGAIVLGDEVEEEEEEDLPVLLAPYCNGCQIRHDGDFCSYRRKKSFRDRR